MVPRRARPRFRHRRHDAGCTPRKRGLAVAVGTLALLALALSTWFLGWRADASPLAGFGSDDDHVQLVLAGLYAVIFAYLPAGLVRPLASSRRAVVLACLGALTLPVLRSALGALLGIPAPSVADGNGTLSDLLFLRPAFMLEGVRGDGFVPHRFRIHHAALYTLALASISLHLLPSPRARLASSAPHRD